MVFQIKQRFGIISSQEIPTYKWDSGSWQRTTTPTKGKVLDIYKEPFPTRVSKKYQELKSQKIASFVVKEDQNFIITGGWQEIKSYIVWYSGSQDGKKYDVRREIAVTFWVAPQEDVNNFIVDGWLNTAIKEIFGLAISLDTIEGWIRGQQSAGVGAYFVPSAMTGRVDEIKPYEAQEVRWEYTKDGRKLKNGVIYRN